MRQHVLKRRQNHSVFSSEEYLFSRIAVSQFFREFLFFRNRSKFAKFEKIQSREN